MTVVFVHGVPETDAIWGPLVQRLTSHDVTDVVLLSPPGFGSRIPRRWNATHLDYRDWLVDQLVELTGEAGPVDLLGHDWGAGHVFGVLAARPDLVRSWACDCTGLLHPDYVWHDAARAWQTPEVGEGYMTALASMDPKAACDMFIAMGFTEEAAEASVVHRGEMISCILPLYRSATKSALTDLRNSLVSTAQVSGLALDPTMDPYVGYGKQTAELLGAKHAPIDGAGHWWMLESPEYAADLLATFWASL